MEIKENKEVLKVFSDYPVKTKNQLLKIRQLIFDVAEEIESSNILEETLKWGEPSYCTKQGSTIRINWKKSNPNYCAIYFNCNTKLIHTFREIYSDNFIYEGNRALLVDQSSMLAENELKHCVSLALTYHKIKHLPLLGA